MINFLKEVKEFFNQNDVAEKFHINFIDETVTVEVENGNSFTFNQKTFELLKELLQTELD